MKRTYPQIKHRSTHVHRLLSSTARLFFCSVKPAFPVQWSLTQRGGCATSSRAKSAGNPVPARPILVVADPPKLVEVLQARNSLCPMCCVFEMGVVFAGKNHRTKTLSFSAPKMLAPPPQAARRSETGNHLCLKKLELRPDPFILSKLPFTKREEGIPK